MTQDDYNEFLSGLAKCKTPKDRRSFAFGFYEKMIEKYGNQFQQNGFIDALIDILNQLK